MPSKQESVIVTRQHRQLPRRWQHNLAVMLDFEEASPHRHGNPHDDGLADPCDVVHPAVQGSVKEVVSGLLKGCQHEDRVLHLCYTKPGDAKDLPLQIKQD